MYNTKYPILLSMLYAQQSMLVALNIKYLILNIKYLILNIKYLILNMDQLPDELFKIISKYLLSTKDNLSARMSTKNFYNNIPFMDIKIKKLDTHFKYIKEKMKEEHFDSLKSRKYEKFLCTNVRCNGLIKYKLYKRALGIITIYKKPLNNNNNTPNPHITRHIPYCYNCMTKYCNINIEDTIILQYVI